MHVLADCDCCEPTSGVTLSVGLVLFRRARRQKQKQKQKENRDKNKNKKLAPLLTLLPKRCYDTFPRGSVGSSSSSQIWLELEFFESFTFS